MVTRDGEGLAGRQADKPGGDSGGGWTPGRRKTTKVQGRAVGGRSQGEDMRDVEQEKSGGTQATALMAAPGGAD